VKAVTERIRGEVKVGDTIQAGIVISNSEIGAGALRLEEMTYRLACLNGAIHGHAIRKSHVGRQAYSNTDLLAESQEYFRTETRQADDQALFLKVQDTIAAVLSERRFLTHLDAMRGATLEKITADPVAVVEVTAKHYGLGQTECGTTLRYLIEGADLSKFGLANALTRASQDVEDYELATVMEEMGGRIFEMPKRDWETLAS
jgi:hypothetical protein